MMRKTGNSKFKGSTGKSAPRRGGAWPSGDVPHNVRVGKNSAILGDIAFKRFYSRRNPAISIGDDCLMDGVQFALGEQAQVKIGNRCRFSNAILLCELLLDIGDYVAIGWNVTVADTDFHPIDPKGRMADSLALSLAGAGRKRSRIDKKAVVIEDNVWIGPNAAILKGVRVGRGSFIEPGALVTSDVPPRSRVMGNPSRIVGRT